MSDKLSEMEVQQLQMVWLEKSYGARACDEGGDQLKVTAFGILTGC